MATLENTALARREARIGGVLDPETQQQVADLNLQGIGLIQEALVASGAVAPAVGAEAGGDAASRRGGRRRRPGTRQGGSASRRAAGQAGGPAGGSARARLLPTLAVPGRDGARQPDAIEWPGTDWLALDPAARQRLAACPYLLFELDFASLLGGIALSPRAVQESRGLPGEPGIAASFVGAEGRVFARMLFQYAWHLARSSPTVAAFVFGTPLALLEPVRTLGVARVEALAAVASGALRLRWDRQPLIWLDWLAAARSGDPAALWSAQLRGLQRIAGACRDAPPST